MKKKEWCVDVSTCTKGTRNVISTNSSAKKEQKEKSKMKKKV